MNKVQFKFETQTFGFLPGIFLRGIYCHANSSIVFGPSLEGSLRGTQTASGGGGGGGGFERPLPVEESQTYTYSNLCFS